jgi:hypothetical protein
MAEVASPSLLLVSPSSAISFKLNKVSAEEPLLQLYQHWIICAHTNSTQPNKHEPHALHIENL